MLSGVNGSEGVGKWEGDSRSTPQKKSGDGNRCGLADRGWPRRTAAEKSTAAQSCAQGKILNALSTVCQWAHLKANGHPARTGEVQARVKRKQVAPTNKFEATRLYSFQLNCGTTTVTESILT